MRITKIEAFALVSPMLEEHTCFTSYGRKSTVASLIARVHTDEGIEGIGETVCNPFVERSLPTLDMALALVKDCLGPALLGENPFDLRRLHWKMDQAMSGNLNVKAAFDVALYDIMGKKLGTPVYNLLGGNCYGRTEFHYDIDFPGHFGFLDTPKAMAELAEKCVRKLGYKHYSIKLGMPGEPIERDLERIFMVFEAIGPNVPLHMDPNTEWGLEKTVKVFTKIRGRNISNVHQPVPAWDIDGLATLTRMFPEIPVYADESVFEGYLAELLKKRAVPGIAFKPLQSGGYYPSLKIIGACEHAGVGVYLNGAASTNVAQTATMHLSLALGPLRAWNLAEENDRPGYTAVHLKLKKPHLVLKGGCITEGRTLKLPTGPGLGIDQINEELLKKDRAVIIS
jgi:L-Ala-D/L-Glu epimerase / N-acetyl-D-glutamate racemase